MGEKDETTARIKSLSENVLPLLVVEALTDADASPYTVVASNVTGFNVLNQSAANLLTVTLTFSDASTLAIPVPAETAYEGAYELAITTIAYAGTTPSFSAELSRRSS